MLQLNVIREKKDFVVERLAVKNIDATATLDQVLALDVDKRKKQTELEGLLAEQNQIAKQIGELFKSGNKEGADELKAKSTQLKERSKQLEEEVANAEIAINDILVSLPNMPHTSVPKGKTPEENEVVYLSTETLPVLPDTAVPHWELTSKYDIIDFELGNKITGAGFPVYKGQGAKLQRALINFFLDRAEKAGYYEVQPPILINADSGYGTGQLPDKEGQMYQIGRAHV